MLDLRGKLLHDMFFLFISFHSTLPFILQYIPLLPFSSFNNLSPPSFYSRFPVCLVSRLGIGGLLRQCGLDCIVLERGKVRLLSNVPSSTLPFLSFFHPRLLEAYDLHLLHSPLLMAWRVNLTAPPELPVTHVVLHSASVLYV